MNGEFSNDLPLNFSPTILSSLKYAPVTSVDVERSFSIYKHILSDRRQSFNVNNLEKHVIINVNSNTIVHNYTF